ncbi:MAG: nitroreductase family deazaflavin-dependent oxidoreductase [Deltaproteobacteria bacterium]|nr:nitroreductase family deazaflavin-dependent oxidoreductase [Deltaproteobacteria bacterium]MBI3388449.1 nitroreductase family deazaflavin-dependent oxidoreductase [Deltaproteobacteria bacterium]
MADLSTTLAAVANAKTLKLTTTGRKSGQQRVAEIWFVVEGDHLLVQAGKNARKGWLVNVKHHPEVALDIAGTKLRGRAIVITDPAAAQRVIDLMRQKYWRAWLASWVGSQIGAGVPVRVEGISRQ